jgi:hypothetical protein
MNTNDIGPKWKDEKERLILQDVYKAFASRIDSTGTPIEFQEWFRGAGIVENHPIQMARTLEINVNYRPIFMMKEIIALAEKHGLALYLREVDSEGKPKE